MRLGERSWGVEIDIKRMLLGVGTVIRRMGMWNVVGEYNWRIVLGIGTRKMGFWLWLSQT